MASFQSILVPFWFVRIEGRKKIRKNVIYVVVSNHQSLLDIPIAYRLFFHFKWVSKAEMFKIPFIGWSLSMQKHIKLKRGDKESVRTMLEDCRKNLAIKNSVFIFPEGTRLFDGSIKNFKDGAFILAKEMKLPILVIIISGTRNALPKYSFDFHGIHRIWVRVAEEIPYGAIAGMTVEEISSMVREKMIGNLKEIELYTNE